MIEQPISRACFWKINYARHNDGQWHIRSSLTFNNLPKVPALCETWWKIDGMRLLFDSSLFLTHLFCQVKMHQKKERPLRFKGKRQSPSEGPHSQRYFIYIYLLRAVCEAGKLAEWGFIRWEKGVSNAAFLLLRQMCSDGGEFILLNMFCLKAGASLRCLSERFLAGFFVKRMLLIA